MMEQFSKYGFEVRTVDFSDAEFIVKLRTNNKLQQHISSTSSEILDQEEWISKYKERERLGEEIYLIFLKDNIRQGVLRIYNVTEDSFEIGSWVFSPKAEKNTSIIAVLITNEIAWDLYPNKTQYFETNIGNTNVIRFNDSIAIRISEDENEIRYKTTKEIYDKKTKMIYRMLIR